MNKNIGNQTIFFERGPSILSSAAIVGKKEGDGPLGKYFDKIESDSYIGKKSWEKAESALIQETISLALEKSNLATKDIDFIVAGDLLNQCTSSSFGIRDTSVPFLGVYGACSTMAESLIISSVLVSGGFAKHSISATSSHFCSAEKQFRLPLEYGGQRPPSAQWTVTGSGAVVIGENSNSPYITHATIGKIVDYGITDANNMGGAMAPAFVDTLISHLNATNRTPDYYDLILSGDLGEIGRSIAIDLMEKEGFSIKNNYNDCGCMIFDNEKQDTHAGGSGCGCSASVLSGYIIPMLREKVINKVLFIATGALMSPTSTMQGESIPGIAHAISIEN